MPYAWHKQKIFKVQRNPLSKMDKIHKKQQISALKEWDNVDDVFVVKIKRGIAPYAKGYSFQLILSDNSGKTMIISIGVAMTKQK